MLSVNLLKQALNDQSGAVYGLLNSVPSPLLVEMIGYAGYDFIILDLEHTGTNPETLENMLRAAECSGLTALVRIPYTESAAMLRALDAGAQGIVVPHIGSPGEIAEVMRICRYHPAGERGISGGRTTGFGRIGLTDYFRQANREIMVVAMIEDRAGVDAIDDILAVPGIDMVLEGAVDLSQDYGVPGDFTHEKVVSAVHKVAEACRRHHIPFCAVPRSQQQWQNWRSHDIRAFLLGDDRGVAFRALKAHREAYSETPVCA